MLGKTASKRLLATAWLFLHFAHWAGGYSFVTRQPLPSQKSLHRHQRIPVFSASQSSAASLQMRDTSASYWFRVGDSVRVVADDVVKAGNNLQNRIGKVVETWEKCDVDPTCCCAEQVDVNMAVRVEFQGTEKEPGSVDKSFMHYFAEAELVKVDPDEASKSTENSPSIDRVQFTWNLLQLAGRRPESILFSSGDTNTARSSQEVAQDAHNSLPFDGMSCTAFKMDHLQSLTRQKPRGISQWEPEAQSLNNHGGVERSEQESSLPFDGKTCVAFKMDHLQSASSQKPRGLSKWEPVSQEEWQRMQQQ